MILVLIASLFGSPPPDEKRGAAPLQLERSVPLAGVEGRFDHFAFDAASKRVVVAALGNGTLEVIPLDREKPTGRISGLKEPQGVLVMPGSGEIAAASGEDGTLKVYEGASLKLLKSLDVG